MAEVDTITKFYLRTHPMNVDSTGEYHVEKNTTQIDKMNTIDSVILSTGRILYPATNSTPKSISYVDTSIVNNPHIYPRYKNPALAFLFSAIPGVGQFYNDEVDKGFIFISAMLAESLVFSLSYYNVFNFDEQSAATFTLISGLAFFVTYLWSAIDAVTTANKLNIANGYTIKAQPTISYNSLTPMGKGCITPGLSISLTF